MAATMHRAANAQVPFYVERRLPFVADSGSLVGRYSGARYTVRSRGVLIAWTLSDGSLAVAGGPLPPTASRHRQLVRGV